MFFVFVLRDVLLSLFPSFFANASTWGECRSSRNSYCVRSFHFFTQKMHSSIQIIRTAYKHRVASVLLLFLHKNVVYVHSVCTMTDYTMKMAQDRGKSKGRDRENSALKFDIYWDRVFLSAAIGIIIIPCIWVCFL